jgi:hypothetical protein
MFRIINISPPGSISPVSGSFITFNTIAVSGTSFNHANLSFGAADSHRAIVVSVHTNSLTAANFADNVTIGGVTATMIVQRDVDAAGSTSNEFTEIWKADVPAGSSGNVLVQLSSSATFCTVGVWSVISLNTSAKFSGSNLVNNGTETVITAPSATIPNLGYGIVALTSIGAGSISYTPTNYTEDFDTVPASARAATAGEFTSTATLTCTANSTITGGAALVWASWGPI